MRLKVLPLETWMCWESALEDCLESGRYPPVPARFHRPGIYLEGTQCWFELENGSAYSYPVASFQYELKLKTALDLNPWQVSALQQIVAARLATRTQRELLRHYRDAMEIRQVGRSSSKQMMQTLKILRKD